MQVDFLKLVISVCTIAAVVLVYARRPSNASTVYLTSHIPDTVYPDAPDTTYRPSNADTVHLRLHIHLGVQVDFLKLVNSVCTIAVVVLVYARRPSNVYTVHLTSQIPDTVHLDAPDIRYRPSNADTVHLKTDRL